VRSLKLRLLGAAAVACLTAFVTAADPTLSADLSGKTIEADVTHLNKLIELSKTKKVGGRVKSTAVLLALYAEDQLGGKDAAKMATLRDEALKIAAKSKMAATVADAAAALKDIKPAAGASTKPLGAEKIIADTKLELHEAMDLFGSAAGGGMNLEKDIQAIKKNGVSNLPAAELIGARTALLADLTLHMPNDKATGANKKAWDDYTKDMKKFALEVATEAAKGKGADLAKIKTSATKLDASCLNCHNKFRAD
jgi:hypothetical protein